jgi:hypothetical protein
MDGAFCPASLARLSVRELPGEPEEGPSARKARQPSMPLKASPASSDWDSKRGIELRFHESRDRLQVAPHARLAGPNVRTRLSAATSLAQYPAPKTVASGNAGLHQERRRGTGPLGSAEDPFVTFVTQFGEVPGYIRDGGKQPGRKAPRGRPLPGTARADRSSREPAGPRGPGA